MASFFRQGTAAMTTKRKRTQATSREGINFIRTLVERNNSTFQEIDLQNDLGNDAYVEFVVDESATGCCVALQIKSGRSYRTASGGFVFHADQDHFEYWASHTLPVFAVIFDPETQQAAWTDITAHLRENPETLTAGPYSIHAHRTLSAETFAGFREHCLGYRDQYSREPSFGRALESFANRDDVERCLDGLRALFAFHRQQAATWYYLISTLSNYRGHPALRPLVARLTHLVGHMDIFWHSHNWIDPNVKKGAVQLIQDRFDRRDALTLLSIIDDAGIDRGTMGQCVHALVDLISDAAQLMASIAADHTQTKRVRHSAILLAASEMQQTSSEEAITALECLRPTLEDEELVDTLNWLQYELRQYGIVTFY